MDPIAPIAALGSTIAADWLRAGRAPDALPAITCQALSSARLHERCSVSALVDWGLRCPRAAFPAQGDPHAQFGDPPLTLWRETQLRIDLQLWIDSAPDIHDHAFSGAFQVLAGGSLQGTYEFIPAHRHAPSLRIGALRQLRLERLSPGDIRPIALGSGLIHSLFHTTRPSATLVVRSEGLHPTTPQSIYLPPGIASASYPSQLHGDPLYQRRLQLLVFLQRTGDPSFGAALVSMLDEADPLQALGLLGYVFDALALGPGGEADATAQLAGLLASVTARYPMLSTHLLPVLQRAHRRRRLVMAREQVHAPAPRQLLALLLYAPDLKTLLSLAPADDPLEWLLDTVDALAAAGSGLPALAAGPPAARVLRALLTGADLPEADDALAAQLRADRVLAPLLS